LARRNFLRAIALANDGNFLPYFTAPFDNYTSICGASCARHPTGQSERIIYGSGPAGYFSQFGACIKRGGTDAVTSTAPSPVHPQTDALKIVLLFITIL